MRKASPPVLPVAAASSSPGPIQAKPAKPMLGNAAASTSPATNASEKRARRRFWPRRLFNAGRVEEKRQIPKYPNTQVSRARVPVLGVWVFGSLGISSRSRKLLQQPQHPLLHHASVRRRSGFGRETILVLHEPIPAFAKHFVVRVTRLPAQRQQRRHVEVKRFVISEIMPGRERAEAQPIEHAQRVDRQPGGQTGAAGSR